MAADTERPSNVGKDFQISNHVGGTMNNASATNNSLFERTFSKVILTLENIRVPDVVATETPSQKDGLDGTIERQLRHCGCSMIQSAGILLKLPQVAMATGQIVFQRFYYSKSFVKHNMETVAMACVHMASKIEEHPRRIRDVLNVFHHMEQSRHQKPFAPMVLDQAYINQKNQVIKAERRILKELGFCVHVKHPHKIIVMYLQILEHEKNQKFVQKAWNYMNDAMRTHVFVAHSPEAIACACIHIASRDLQIPMPQYPRPWYYLFDTDDEEVDEIGGYIMEHYQVATPPLETLEAAVDLCKKALTEAKLKSKVEAIVGSSGVDGDGGTHKSTPLNATDSKPDSLQGSPHKQNSPGGRKVENGKGSSDDRRGHSQRRHSQTPSSRSRSPSYHVNHKTPPRGYSDKYNNSKRSRRRRSRSRSGSPLPAGKKRGRKQHHHHHRGGAKRSRSSSGSESPASPRPKKHHKKRRGKTRRASRSRSRSVQSVSPSYRSRSESRDRNRKRRKDRHYYRR